MNQLPQLKKPEDMSDSAIEQELGELEASVAEDKKYLEEVRATAASWGRVNGKSILRMGLAAAVAGGLYVEREAVDKMFTGDKTPTREVVPGNAIKTEAPGFTVSKDANLSKLAKETQSKRPKKDDTEAPKPTNNATAKETKVATDPSNWKNEEQVAPEKPAPKVEMATQNTTKPVQTLEEIKENIKRGNEARARENAEIIAKMKKDIEAQYAEQVELQRAELIKNKAEIAKMRADKAAADATPNFDKMSDDEFYKYFHERPALRKKFTGPQAGRWNDLMQSR
ncbi:MAG: hypothetical protein WCI76_01575 [bacterium]